MASSSPPAALVSFSGKFRSKDPLLLGLSCVALIAVSYLGLVSSSSSSFLPFHHHIRAFLGMDARNSGPPSRSTIREMEAMFAKAAMPNNSRTVILTTLNAAWADTSKGSMMDLFLEGFRNGEDTQGLLQHLVLVCTDQKAFQRCTTLHPFCLKIRTPGVDFSGEQLYLTSDYVKLIWRRIRFLKVVLDLNYNFVFTDLDVLWLRNPMPLLLSKEELDFQIACDLYNGDPKDAQNRPNAGFVYVRATNATIKFYEYWYTQRVRNPEWADQEVLNVIKLEDTFASFHMNIRFLDTKFFGGFCAINTTDMTQALTMHATCCKGVHAKLADLQTILDKWKQFKMSFKLTLAPTPISFGGNVLVRDGRPLPPMNITFPTPYACPLSWW